MRIPSNHCPRTLGRYTDAEDPAVDHKTPSVAPCSAAGVVITGSTLSSRLFVAPSVGLLMAVSAGAIELGEDFFNEIIRCPIPIDLNTLRAMKRSPLGLDLYLWLTYRTFGLKRPLRLTWPVLYRQFGVDPARSNDKFTVRDFRADCLRELKKIKDAWPDLHYQTVKGALLLSPSPPRIPPSQLRLVE